METTPATEEALLARITENSALFGGKPMLRGRRLLVEHVLGMLAAGHTVESLIAACPWLEADDVEACVLYARRAGRAAHGEA